MQISLASDFSFRVLLYLSSCPEEDNITIAEVALQLGVSRPYLMKVVARLSKLGWVDSVRGRHGGIRIASKAAELKIGAIMRRLENSGPLIDCKALNCVLADRCTYFRVLEEARRAFFSSLDGYRLQDLATPPTSRLLYRLHRQAVQMSVTQ
ncbi:MAG: RrF2 family transcriptional regulator [Janthinobacterium lividum]